MRGQCGQYGLPAIHETRVWSVWAWAGCGLPPGTSSPPVCVLLSVKFASSYFCDTRSSLCDFRTPDALWGGGLESGPLLLWQDGQVPRTLHPLEAGRARGPVAFVLGWQLSWLRKNSLRCWEER